MPPAFRAAQIALVAIKQNRHTTWAELIKSGVDTRLTDEQMHIVEGEMDVVSELNLTVGKPVTFTYCPECGRTAFFGAGTVPAKCTLSFGCKGKPEKASATPKKVVEPVNGEDDVPEALLPVTPPAV